MTGSLVSVNTVSTHPSVGTGIKINQQKHSFIEVDLLLLSGLFVCHTMFKLGLSKIFVFLAKCLNCMVCLVKPNISLFSLGVVESNSVKSQKYLG